MQNFVKILLQIKKFPIQGLASNCLVCMAAICYSAPTEQLLSEKRTGVKFQIDSLKTKGTSLHIYTQTDMAKSTQLIILIIYVYM